MTYTFGSFAQSALGARVQSAVDGNAFGSGGTGTGELIIATAAGVYLYDGTEFTLVGTTAVANAAAGFGGRMYCAFAGGSIATRLMIWDPDSSAWVSAATGVPAVRFNRRCLVSTSDVLLGGNNAAGYVLTEVGGTWASAGKPPEAGATLYKFDAAGGLLTAFWGYAFDLSSGSWVLETPRKVDNTPPPPDLPDITVGPFEPIAITYGAVGGGLRHLLSESAENFWGTQYPGGGDSGSPEADDYYVYTVAAETTDVVGDVAYVVTGTPPTPFDCAIDGSGAPWVISNFGGTVEPLQGTAWTARTNAGNPFSSGMTNATLHYHATTGHMYLGLSHPLTIDGRDEYLVRWTGSEWEAPSSTTRIASAVRDLRTLSFTAIV